VIGGYQVIKKWLSYREEQVLGRPMWPDEVREITTLMRRVVTLVLLSPALEATIGKREYVANKLGHAFLT
jgi:hypothetical protein